MSDLTLDITTNTIKSGNSGINLDPAASEVVKISNGIFLPDGTESEPSIRFTDDDNTGIFSPENDTISMVTNGSETTRFSGVADTVNYLELSASTTGNNPTIGVRGADTNLGLNIRTQGTGDFNVISNAIRLTLPERNQLFVNGNSVIVDDDDVSRLKNNVGYLTSVSVDDVGLGNVDNTSDADKPISNAVASILDTKADSTHTHTKDDITDFSDADYATSVQGSLANSALQSGANISELTNDVGYLTTSSAGAIADLTDVTITEPTTNQVLAYNGSDWVNQDAQSGSGGNTPTLSEERGFSHYLTSRFAKSSNMAYESFESDRATISTTAHCPATDVIVNVHVPSNGAWWNQRITFFKVDRVSGTRSVISSTMTSDLGAVKWVDISEDGDYIALAVKTDGLDQVVILTTTDGWMTYNQDKIDVTPTTDNNIISVALNSDGSSFFASYGNEQETSITQGGIVKWVRSANTWSFDSTVFSNTVGSGDEVVLLQGQIDPNSCAFLLCEYGSDSISYHSYANNAGWSEVWTSGNKDSKGKFNMGFVSFDGNTILHKVDTNTVKVAVNVLSGSADILELPESSNDSPSMMTGDGRNILFNSGATWVTFRQDDNSFPEIGFFQNQIPWTNPSTYGTGMGEVTLRSSKGNTHHFFQSSPWLTYACDVLYTGIDYTDWVNPGEGINYL